MEKEDMYKVSTEILILLLCTLRYAAVNPSKLSGRITKTHPINCRLLPQDCKEERYLGR